MPQAPSIPKNCITVRTYREFHANIKAFATGDIHFLLLLGRGGIGKTQAARRLIKRKLVIDTKLTPFDLYRKLYDHKDQIVIIDDVHDIYRNSDAVALLKALTDSTEVKTVSWNSTTTTKGRLPQSFKTTSRLLMIVNDWRTANANIRSLEDRGQNVFFNPSADELHLEVQRGGWFHDQEVYKFIFDHLDLVLEPSFRNYVLASMRKNAGLAWEPDLLTWLCGDERLADITRLMNDPAFKTEKEKEAEFTRRGYGTRRTYYNFKKRWRHNKTTALKECPKLKSAAR
jgi:hypothetical protein